MIRGPRGSPDARIALCVPLRFSVELNGKLECDRDAIRASQRKPVTGRGSPARPDQLRDQTAPTRDPRDDVAAPFELLVILHGQKAGVIAVAWHGDVGGGECSG